MIPGMLAGAGVQLIGGLLGNRSARKAQQARDALNQASATATTGAQQTYGNQLLNLAGPWADAYAYRPVNATTGFASTNIDPVTGQVGYELAAPWAGARDAAMGQAQDMWGRAGGMFGRGEDVMRMAGDFDPRTHAAERYNSAQALLAPGDQRAEQGLLQQLYAKGGYGLTTNTPAAGGGSVGVNPYVNTFANARNQRNAQMSFDSLNEGERYLDNILKRGYGMFAEGRDMLGAGNTQLGQAAGIEQRGINALGLGQEWGGIFNSARRDWADKFYGLQDQGNRAHRDAVLGYYNTMRDMDPGYGADSRSQMFSSLGDTLGGLFSGGAFNGLFGSGNRDRNALYRSAYGFGQPDMN